MSTISPGRYGKYLTVYYIIKSFILNGNCFVKVSFTGELHPVSFTNEGSLQFQGYDLVNLGHHGFERVKPVLYKYLLRGTCRDTHALL